MGRLIDRVQLTSLKIIQTGAGNVMHAMRCSDAGYAGFGEAYFSCLDPGATKGWKRHRLMTLNLVVPLGFVTFAVVDPKAGIGNRFDLGPVAYGRLTVPPGLWVAFKSRSSEPSMILNVADMQHDPAESDGVPLTAIAFDWEAAAEQRLTIDFGQDNGSAR